jgi:pimeloyl-ACP methyl ester carboxylesterase
MFNLPTSPSLLVFTSVILAFILLWLSVSFFLYLQAGKSVFEREESQNKTLDSKNFKYEREWLLNKAGNKIELIIAGKGPKSPVILYLHGNVGRLDNIMSQIINNYSLVSPAYPGYSQSQGRPSTRNIYETVDLSIEYIISKMRLKQQDIIVLGHSLGGSPALYAATKYPNLKKVVLVNTFYSIASEAWRRYSIFGIFGGLILPSNRLAKKANAKIRQFHNPNDKQLPYSGGQRLFKELASKDKQFFDLEDGNHSDFDVNYVLTTDTSFT